MKIALVHDWLNVKSGGAERVFFELAKMYPEADLYSLICNQKLFAESLNDRKVQTSFLQYAPGALKKRPQFMLPLIPRAVDNLDFSGYDLIVSSSSAWAKNIQKPKNCVHICYCHTPARMLWDSWPKYLDGQRIRPFKVGPLSRFIISRTTSRVRLWDFYGSNRVDHFLANSNYIADRIRKFYRRGAEVVYPPVNVGQFKSATGQEKGSYYLILSVLSKYKNIELVIKTFNKNKLPLVIAGDGPDKDRLIELAASSPNIKFLGRVSEAKKIELLQQAKGLVFANIEDFGLTPVEAMAASTPVIARRGGGANETVVANETGVFFDQDNEDSLNQAITRAEQINWSENTLLAQAKKFSAERFVKKLARVVDSIEGTHE
ncbi:glycosyltransferase [Candidatus Saccharibacteria bacterium]|nr:glycosyltransferase [Candidatus Saccharibacteria bacterium]